MKDFFKKNWVFTPKQAENPMRHGVSRKRRELKDKKDIIKLFRKKPQEKGVN